MENIRRPAFQTTILCIVLTFLTACAQPVVTSVNYAEQRGLYIVGYTSDSVVRERMEDQLVADLTALDIIAYPSYPDIEDISGSSAGEVISRAGDKTALGVIVINQVAADGSNSLSQNPNRISPVHPTLQEFYSYSRDMAGESSSQDEEVFAEVNLYILDDGVAKNFWNGTTWSFNADNRGGAVRDISSIISRQLGDLRDQFLPD